MRNFSGYSLLPVLVACAAIAWVPPVAGKDKIKVESLDDLPRTTYPLDGPASEDHTRKGAPHRGNPSPRPGGGERRPPGRGFYCLSPEGELESERAVPPVWPARE